MDYEATMNLYHYVFIGCGIAAIAFLALAILLFFLLKIPQVFGELTGRRARKAIAEMGGSTGGDASPSLSSSRKIGEDGRRHRNGKSSADSGRIRRRSGRLDTPSARMTKTNAQPAPPAAPASPAPEPVPSGTANLYDWGSSETDVLPHESADRVVIPQETAFAETEVLDGGEAITGRLSRVSTGAEETDVLYAETGLLKHPSQAAAAPEPDGNMAYVAARGEGFDETEVLSDPDTSDFVILRNIVVVHTDEVVF